MPDQLAPVVKTPVTAPVFTRAVIDAWAAVDDSGDDAPKSAVGILFAHYMIETGGLNCFGWNIGNVKYTPGCGFNYHCLHGVWEGATAFTANELVVAGQAVIDPNASHQKSCAPLVSVVFNPPHPATRFVAYPSLSDAMGAHLFLLCKKRYATAWPALLAGDVMAFAAALRARGYMTSSAESYGNGMMPPFKHFMTSGEYEAAILAKTKDVTEPIYEFSGGIIHPDVEFEPVVYTPDSEDIS